MPAASYGARVKRTHAIRFAAGIGLTTYSKTAYAGLGTYAASRPQFLAFGSACRCSGDQHHKDCEPRSDLNGGNNFSSVLIIRIRFRKTSFHLSLILDDVGEMIITSVRCYGRDLRNLFPICSLKQTRSKEEAFYMFSATDEIEKKESYLVSKTDKIEED